MQRRELLQSALALAAAGLPAPALLLGLPARAEPRKLGQPQPFDYDWLKNHARVLAARPYQAPPQAASPRLAGLSWDQWQAISFKDDHSLWREQHLNLQVRLFHLGWHMLTPVRIHEVVNRQAQELAYDPALFDYDDSGLSGASLPKDLGFAGFRVLYHTDWARDVAAFQGASYFRAVDGDMQYGMSARGLAIDSGLSPEEFPIFTDYWLERPAPGSDGFTVYALLDSPSAAGAYRFQLTMGDTLVMEVDAALYVRRAIERIGIAPLTSMFQCGENDKRRAQDWRPEIHDSDGLQLWTGSGEWIWRPLVNPPDVRTNLYFDDNPRGFGLLQRDRNFDHYQDDGVFYNLRPSLWVEPRYAGANQAGWGQGAVMLVELPTNDETNDNIVAFWNPQQKPQPGEELLYGYRLYWCRTPPVGPKLAIVVATRTGIGGVIGQKRTHFSWRFVVDFAGPNLAMLGDKTKVEAVIEASRGSVELVSARPLDAIKGWRAMFDLAPGDGSEPINLRLYLRTDQQALTETWIYQWTPPPMAEREF
jgi:periplasmic glucans biosynthesis protein